LVELLGLFLAGMCIAPFAGGIIGLFVATSNEITASTNQRRARSKAKKKKKSSSKSAGKSTWEIIING